MTRTVDENLDGDERCFSPWVHEQQPSVETWYGGRSASPPTFSGDYLDKLSRDLWTVSQCSLLDYHDNDADYGSRMLLARVAERSVCGSYCFHATGTSMDDGCPTSRCPLSSVDVPSSSMTSSDGISTSGSLSSSPSNSLDDEDDVYAVHREPPAQAWKRRRRRRQRRWSRPSSSTSRAPRITRHLSLDYSPVDRGPHILRSILLHGCGHGGYRSPHEASTTSGPRSVGPVVAGRTTLNGCYRHGRVAAAVPQQPRRAVSTPLTPGGLFTSTGNEADAATIRRRCLEDHCYFNKKHEALIDYSRIGRCQTVSVTNCTITLLPGFKIKSNQ